MVRIVDFIISFTYNRVVQNVTNLFRNDSHNDHDTVATVETWDSSVPHTSARERSLAAIQALREEDDKYNMFAPMFYKVAVLLISFPVVAYLIVVLTGALDSDKDAASQPQHVTQRWTTIVYEPFKQVSSIAMSADGSIVAVGKSGGCIQIFHVDPSWKLMDEICDANSSIQFGSALALSNDGSILAVSGTLQEKVTKFGFVRTYQNNGAVWSIMGQDLMTGSVTRSIFGPFFDLSASGIELVVGELGKVRVHHFNSSHWEMVGQTLQGSQSFGASVSLSAQGDFVAIGSPNASTNGRLEVFGLENNRWRLVGSPIVGDSLGHALGQHTSLVANEKHLTVATSTLSQDSSPCRVRVFESLDGQNWSQVNDDIVARNAQCTFVDLSDDAQVLALGSHTNTNLLSIDKRGSWERLMSFDVSGGHQVALSGRKGYRRLAVAGENTDSDFLAIYQAAI